MIRVLYTDPEAARAGLGCGGAAELAFTTTADLFKKIDRALATEGSYLKGITDDDLRVRRHLFCTL
jgi:hypothetical protein